MIQKNTNKLKMSKEEAIVLRNKITEGIKLSAKKLIEAKKKVDGQLVYSINGEIVIVNARDIDSNLPNL